ncbi:MAG TPA: hypothetical protein VM143_08455 [Acidimicrobiales bacterium]|nr:hypothetical protein [Acidimicrobiales bacterium]
MSATVVPEDRFAAVWGRLRRLDIERRNAVAVIECDGDGVAEIRCGGIIHRATASAVELQLHDHDLVAERSLLGLGAELPACLIYAAVYDDAVDGARFLRAWADDVEGDRLVAAREDWVGNYWEYWPTDPAAARVLFGPRLQKRVAMDAARRAAIDPARVSLVVRATQTRARRAFVRSLASVDAHRRPDALVPVRIRVGTGTPEVRGRLSQGGSGVDLRLPIDWLWTVWGPGLAVVDDRFVLAAGDGGLRTVEWFPSGGPASEHVPEVVPVRRSP